jgi:hypothetical protein
MASVTHCSVSVITGYSYLSPSHSRMVTTLQGGVRAHLSGDINGTSPEYVFL